MTDRESGRSADEAEPRQVADEAAPLPPPRTDRPLRRRLELAGSVVREVWRAVSTPAHLVWYLLWQRTWKRRARAALDAPLPDDPFAPIPAALEALLSRRPPGPGSGSAPPPARHVFLSAGEASGVGHARELVAAILAACAERGVPPPRFTLFGSTELARTTPDARIAWPLAEHPQVGIADVLKNVAFFVRAHGVFLDVLDEDRPDVVVLVDYPGMHLVMARAAQRRRVPTIHYVAPQYWAWGPWRLGRYRKAVDATLTILPFEPAFFRDRRLTSAYVGHPLVDAMARDPVDPARVASISGTRPLVLLPGARRRELGWHLEGMLRIVGRLRATHGAGIRCVIPQRQTAAAERTRAALEALPEAGRATAGGPVEVVEGDPRPWMAGARAVLAKSGTASLEACLHGAPTVIVYRVATRFYRFVYHNLLTVPMFGAANLASNRLVAPEFVILDEEEDWEAPCRALLARWPDSAEREAALAALEHMRARLGPPGASERAARFVLPYCGAGRTAP